MPIKDILKWSALGLNNKEIILWPFSVSLHVFLQNVWRPDVLSEQGTMYPWEVEDDIILFSVRPALFPCSQTLLG